MIEPDGIAEELQQQNDALRQDLVGLRQDMKDYHRASMTAVAALQDEIETQRILTRYNRRTWFEVMAWLCFGTALLADVGRAYAHSGWWGLLFWTSRHGAGGPWEWAARAVGFTWQVGFVGWLTRRAQVPEELLSRVAAGAPKAPGPRVRL